MRKKWDINIVPGSHLDYGWAASPGECFSYITEVIRTAIEDMADDDPDFKFTIEYAIFLQHFLEVYPEYLPVVKQLLKEGRLEVCSTMSGCIEQWLDGEMLIHQLVRAKRWVRETLDYDPVTAQHTDLPGHIIQIAQFLRGAEIRHLAYSRYHPPASLHRWRSPDGSEVVACCHFQEGYDRPWDWSGYGWGRTLFVNNKDMEKVYRELPAALERRDRIWPKGVSALLMGCQSDLEPGEPEMLERIAQWNERYPDWRIRVSTITEFFKQVDPEKLPVYQGEAPYGFFALPSIYIPCAQAMRRGENAITAAEKWSVFAQMAGLGRVQRDRIGRARDAMFLPHDHNTAGRRGEINDAERLKDATHCLLEGESILQENAMKFTVHIGFKKTGTVPSDRRETGLSPFSCPVTVFNSLSWNRDDVVETYIELRMTGVQSLNIVNSKGEPIPSQILEVDERLGRCRVYFVFVAKDVPAHGYETFYVRPSKKKVKTETSLKVTATGIRNRFFTVRVRDGRVSSIRWNGKELVRKGPRRFNEIYALEDRQTNIESSPWEVDENYTGKEWDSRITRAEVVEQGPVRAVLRIHGNIMSSKFSQDIVLYDNLERVDLRHTLHNTMKMHTMTRVAYPLNVPGGEATYESPYGAVRLEKDEMPHTFRGHGERWVQKWIDISNADYGVTLATRQVSHVITNDTIEPILVRTALDCGTPFYYYDQNQTYTLEHALRPHLKHWKQAAAHRAGWEYNNPLCPCNWTTCSPIKPLRRSRRLPERQSFLRVNRNNVVVTAVAPSAEDPGCIIVRVVEFAGRSTQVTLTFNCHVAEAREVNFLEKNIRNLSVSGNKVELKVKRHGIHTVTVQLSD